MYLEDDDRASNIRIRYSDQVKVHVCGLEWVAFIS